MDATWSDLQVVHAALVHGSFTAAAQALSVGQATVSRRVAAVEQSLGQVLFDRHRTGLVPTEAAVRLRPHLEALAAAATGAAHAVDGLEATPRGEVRLAAPPGLCVDWVPPLAARLARSHPELHLRVLSDIDVHDLDRREADIALRLAPTERGDLLVRRLTSFTGALYAHPELVARLPDPLEPSDVPIVSYAEPYETIALARFIDGLGCPVVLRSNDYLVQRAVVAHGVAAGLFGDVEARALGLVRVPLPLAGPLESGLFLVVHRALRHVPRVAVVIEAIDALNDELGRAGSGLGSPMTSSAS